MIKHYFYVLSIEFMKFDHKEIYGLAKHYDLINDFDYDIPFFIKYAKNCKGKVLELGCGTGRIVIPLAKEKISIVGLDISEEMIEEGKQKAKKEGLNIDFRLKNIIDFNLQEKFDLILCVHNTLSHIVGLENLKLFFLNIQRHLTKNGNLIIQVFNPDFYFFTRNPEEKFPLKKYKDPSSIKMVELSENNFYDDASQINYIKWYFKIGEKEIVKSWNQRVYFPQELDALIQLFGFEIIKKFGDFDETPFNELPDTQIIVCKVK